MLEPCSTDFPSYDASLWTLSGWNACHKSTDAECRKQFGPSAAKRSIQQYVVFSYVRVRS